MSDLISDAIARLRKRNERAMPRSVPRYESPESAEPQMPPCLVCQAMLINPALRNLFLMLEHECPKAETPEPEAKLKRDDYKSSLSPLCNGHKWEQWDAQAYRAVIGECSPLPLRQWSYWGA